MKQLQTGDAFPSKQEACPERSRRVASSRQGGPVVANLVPRSNFNFRCWQCHFFRKQEAALDSRASDVRALRYDLVARCPASRGFLLPRSLPASALVQPHWLLNPIAIHVTLVQSARGSSRCRCRHRRKRMAPPSRRPWSSGRFNRRAQAAGIPKGRSIAAVGNSQIFDCSPYEERLLLEGPRFRSSRCRYRSSFR